MRFRSATKSKLTDSGVVFAQHQHSRPYRNCHEIVAFVTAYCVLLSRLRPPRSIVSVMSVTAVDANLSKVIAPAPSRATSMVPAVHLARVDICNLGIADGGVGNLGICDRRGQLWRFHQTAQATHAEPSCKYILLLLSVSNHISFAL